MKLAPHFTLAEMTVTSTGIDNTPDSEQHLRNLYVAAYGMECIRAMLGGLPIHVSSAYRNRQVNSAVGGVPTSDHPLGFAVDWKHSRMNARDCCRVISESDLLYHQLILERSDSLIHISFNPKFERQNMRQPGGPGTRIEYVRSF